MDARSSASSSHRTLTAFRRYGWLCLALAVATWPVAGVFTGTRVFMLRDLTLYFWPKYLWLRNTVWSGSWPWWDPYMGAGHSAAADALNQLFLLPTLALRLLLPEPLGFNLWVALPFPLAAWGGYLYFRRYATPAGSALGAITFAAAGPIVSTGNFPNMSWSVLFIPWMLWALDRCAERLTPRRLAVVALLFAGQCCAGEPVTLAATAVLAVGYIAVAAPLEIEQIRRRLTLLAATFGALATGAALAAVQLVPLWVATQASVRANRVPNGAFWSTHPLTMLETVAPQLFGNYAVTFMAYQPWLKALNSGRDPFFPSLYVGMGVVLLAGVGLLAGGRRRVTLFWTATALFALIGAFGSYTPLYPMAQAYLPIVGSFRYPAKYLVFICMALSVYVVLGWSVLERLRTRIVPDESAAGDSVSGESVPDTTAPEEPAIVRARRLLAVAGLLLGAAAYVGAVLVLVFPDTAALGLYRLARFFEIPMPVRAVELMMPELPAHLARLVLIALGTAGVLWVALSTRREARLAQGIIYAVILLDLAVTNGVFNPTVELARVSTPGWIDVVRQHPHERFYMGGRLWGGLQDRDPESPTRVTLPPVSDLNEVRAVTSSQLVTAPSGVGAREMMSFDLASMFPREYTRVHELFSNRDREARLQLLRRGGVRYCIMREPLPEGAVPLSGVPNLKGVSLFECDPKASRVAVIAEARIVEKSEQQAQNLFLADGGDDLLMLKAAAPPPAGTPGAPRPPSATLRRDEPLLVEVDATVDAGGGYLLLRDSYSPAWRVEVDDRPAEMLRANLLFRAVHLAPGTHTVRFTYRPMPLYYGAGVSGVAALGLLVMCCWPTRASRVAHEAPAVFTVSDKPVIPA